MHHSPDYIRAMREPVFYPHPVKEVSLRETHISWVFLTGSRAYKVKKPVDLGFLDFTTLDRREHFCRQEVNLNRRLAADVYRGVVAITREGRGYRLDGGGEVVDFAVEMRQLPSSETLKQRLPEGRFDAAAIDRLAERLVQFYEGAATGEAIDAAGAVETIASNCEENFTQTGAAAGVRFDRRAWEVIAAATRGFLENHAGLFQRRVAKGRIRDGHGDLRTDHVYLTDDGIRIVDCIEFNERFRFSDVACDLAFLAMEMDEEGFSDQAAALIDAFVRRCGDLQLFAMLDFYKCYRAMVRLKVLCLRMEQAGVGEAEREAGGAAIDHFLGLAYRYAVRFSRPVLWVVWGMAAAGKSTVARVLADVLDITVLRSDVVRKQLFERAARDDTVSAFEEGIYSRPATALTYGKLLRLAQAEIEQGHPVILDATFSRRNRRREALRLAAETGAAIVFVECTCPEEMLRQRLAARVGSPSVSDARLQHFDDLKAAFEPGDELPEPCRIQVDTRDPVASGLRRVFTRLQTPNNCLEMRSTVDIGQSSVNKGTLFHT
jgi:aminoglycoside phosphotransferase family enzyme/predicted kinase